MHTRVGSASASPSNQRGDEEERASGRGASNSTDDTTTSARSGNASSPQRRPRQPRVSTTTERQDPPLFQSLKGTGPREIFLHLECNSTLKAPTLKELAGCSKRWRQVVTAKTHIIFSVLSWRRSCEQLERPSFTWLEIPTKVGKVFSRSCCHIRGSLHFSPTAVMYGRRPFKGQKEEPTRAGR